MDDSDIAALLQKEITENKFGMTHGHKPHVQSTTELNSGNIPSVSCNKVCLENKIF